MQGALRVHLCDSTAFLLARILIDGEAVFVKRKLIDYFWTVGVS